MNNEDSILFEFENWFSKNEESLIKLGLVIELNHSPVDHSPSSIQFIAEGGNRIGELIVWSSGMAELQRADVGSGEVVPRHLEVGSSEDLRGALNEVLEWVSKSVN